MAWQTVLPLSVCDVGVALQRDADSGRSQLRQGDHVFELTPAEFDALGQQPAGDLESALRQTGYSIIEPDRSNAFYEDVLALHDRAQRGGGNAVFLDTTTINNAVSLVESAVAPTAVGLLDLAVVTFALVMYDRVVMLNGGQRLARAGDAVLDLGLQPDHRVLRDTLWSMSIEAARAGAEQPAMSRWQSAWAKLIGTDAGSIRLDMDAYDQYTDSPGNWTGEIAGQWGSELSLRWLREPRLAEARDKYLSVITLRTIFNDWVDTRIDVPYLASSLRAPVHYELIAARARRQLITEKLLARVAPEEYRPGIDRGPYRAVTSAPFALALVLKRMANPDDYWTVVREQRNRMAPLRQQLREDHDEWHANPKAFVDKLVGQINRAASSAPKDVVNVFTTLAPLYSGDPYAAFVCALAKVLAIAASTKPALQLYWRVFQPELQVLFDLQREAKSIGELSDQVRHIWGPEPNQTELQLLSAVQPRDFLKLGDLDR